MNFFEWLPANTSGHRVVVEFGSMFSERLGQIHESVARRIGIEAWKPYIEAAKFHECEVFHGDMREFEKYVDQSECDCAMFIDTLEHLEESDARDLMARVMNRFHKVLLFVPNGPMPQVRDVFEMGADELQTHRSTWNEESVRSLGFTDVTVSGSSIYAVWKRPSGFVDERSSSWSGICWVHEWTGNENILDKWSGFDPNGKAVLEIGCGSGHFLEQCAKAGASSLCGIDVSPSAIAAAKERFSALGIPFTLVLVPDEDPNKIQEVDMVYSYTVLQHLAQETVDEYLRLVRRKLKTPGGRAFFQIYSRPDQGPRLDEASVRKMVEDAGLVIEALETRQNCGDQFYVTAKVQE